MPKLLLTTLHTEDPGAEAASATRERLKASFPAGSVRRMSQLGLLLGHCLGKVQDTPATGPAALVYASRFAEGRALEDFLASFPAASPTGFQTSIHPSGPQQGMIARKLPIASFFPLPGGPNLAGQALLTTLLCPEAEVVLCGAEERGTWLTEQAAASDRSFAFACTLRRTEEEAPTAQTATVATAVETPLCAPVQVLAELTLTQAAEHDSAAASGALSLPALFELLHQRLPYDGPSSPGWRLKLVWR